MRGRWESTELSKPETKRHETAVGAQDAGRVPLERMVEQLLLGRLDGLDGPSVAAFVSGWSSVLEIIRRVEVTLPDATPEVVEAFRQLSSAIELAQRAVLADPDDQAPSG